MKIKTFVLAWDDKQFAAIPQSQSIVPINLTKLHLINGIKNENQQLAEDRIFLSHTVDAHIYGTDTPEFIGFATWRWHEKFKVLRSYTEWEHFDLRSDCIYVPAIAKMWYEESEIFHPGMEKYLKELVELTGMTPYLPNGFYCNNFICSWRIYAGFQQFFREVFMHFHNKYGYSFDFEFKLQDDSPRKAACFYERVAALYFSNKTSPNPFNGLTQGLRMVELGNAFPK